MNWLTVCGEELDCFLNALFLWFVPPTTQRNQTISEHAALAKESGYVWGCVLCRWLSLTVERNHCSKTLAGVALTRIAALLAGAQLIGIVLVTLFLWLVW